MPDAHVFKPSSLQCAQHCVILSPDLYQRSFRGNPRNSITCDLQERRSKLETPFRVNGQSNLVRSIPCKIRPCSQRGHKLAFLAISLLLLWSEKINLERVALRDGMAVLKVIAARDEHASRAVENCPWLQKTKGKIVLNPDKISRAIAVARAFCTQSAPEWSEDE